jgi:hypothetical protein
MSSGPEFVQALSKEIKRMESRIRSLEATPARGVVTDDVLSWCEKVATVNAAYEEAKIGNSDQAIADAEYDRYETLLAFQHWWQNRKQLTEVPDAPV